MKPLLALILVLSANAAVHPWEKQEITLTASRAYANPYADVTAWDSARTKMWEAFQWRSAARSAARALSTVDPRTGTWQPAGDGTLKSTRSASSRYPTSHPIPTGLCASQTRTLNRQSVGAGHARPFLP